MATISEFLDALLPDNSPFDRDELKQLVGEALTDNRLFIRHMGELTQEYIELRALGQINNEELRELMEDVVELNKLPYLILSAQAKVRAERISDELRELVIDNLLGLI